MGFLIPFLLKLISAELDGTGHGTEDIQDIYADTLGGITGSVISSKLSWRF